MGTLAAILAIVAAGLVAGQAAARLVRAAHQRSVRQGAMLDAGLDVLDHPRLARLPHGFPVLQGAWNGTPVDLRLSPDLLELRKLPTLWLVVSRLGPAARPRLTASRRRIGAAGDLPTLLSDPAKVNADWRLSVDGAPPATPVLAALEVLLDALGPRLREVEITPAGLRLTWLHEEAARGRYLLARDAEFTADPVPPALIEKLCAALATLDAAFAAPRRAVA